MSFLNSVLNSIASGQDRSSVAPPPKYEKRDGPLPTVPARLPASSGLSKTENAPTAKRKAEDSLPGLKSKVAKVDASVPPKRSITGPQGSKATTGQQAISSEGNGVTPTSDVPKKEPKKGSFAEIMARAKANQSKPANVGMISHKPKEKISFKQELKLSKQALKERKLGIKRGDSQSNSTASSRPQSPRSAKHNHQDLKNAKSAPAKPKFQPAYRGTMHASKSAPSKMKDSPKKRRQNEYAGTDEELDEEEDYDDWDDEEGGGRGGGGGDDYGSDESDDMEAGFDDGYEEEMTALKSAKKEDEREAKLEAQLKKDKEEKKRRLEMLAKRAKPQRY